MSSELIQYSDLLTQIKARIRQAQIKATLSANAEMIVLYWDVGRMIKDRKTGEGWGKGILRRLAADLKNELPEIKGFSERNLQLMIQFHEEYPELLSIPQRPVAELPGLPTSTENVPQPVAQSSSSEIVQRLVAQISWAHNILLIQQVKDMPTRLWYMQQTIEQGWSRDVLGLMIKSGAHKRQGDAVTNFHERLPSPQSDLARQLLKDPYIFDFLTLTEPFEERELEAGLVKHLEKFLLELGQGFAFVGRQYHLEVSDKDFYLDLLFYHLKLRCFVVIELKGGTSSRNMPGK